MADTYWSGAVSGAWNVAGNWTNGVPATGDRAIVPRTATASITSGLSQGAVDLAVFITEDGYAGNIGAPGSPLVIGADIAKFYGSGAVYWQNDGTGTDEVYVDSPNKTNALTFSGNGISYFFVVRGKVIISSGPTITELHITRSAGGGSFDAIVEANGATLATVNMNAGQLTNTGAITNAFVSGAGRLTTTGAITLLTVSGGVVNYESTSALGEALVVGGLLDLTTSDNVQSAGTIIVCPPGRCLYDQDIVTVTTFRDVLTEIGEGPVR